MKNLINAVTAKHRNELERFIFDINNVTERKELENWRYSDLIPKGKLTLTMSFDALKAYLIKRKEKAVNKAIEREVSKIKAVYNAGELISVKISIEWKRSQMWGSNPKAEAWCLYRDNNGNIQSEYAQTGSIGGCGYDKQSTAVSECLNQFNEVLKPLYVAKNNSTQSNNHEMLGYGSGYGLLPNIEGGVGVSCYYDIFKRLGFEFKTVASGKTFDVYTIEKMAVPA